MTYLRKFILSQSSNHGRFAHFGITYNHHLTLHTFIHFSNEFFKIDVFHTKKIYTLIMPHIVTTVTILEKNTFLTLQLYEKLQSMLKI